MSQAAVTVGPGIAPAAAPALQLTVTERELIAEDVVELTLQAAGGDHLPSWTAGAHIDLLLGPNLIRQYSLCGAPDTLHQWRIAVRLEPAGRGGSRHIHEFLHPGALVEAVGPRNHFPLMPAQRHLFIAGGIGITPLLPLLHQAQAEGTDWQLHYGGRRRAAMPFLSELAPYGDRVQLWPSTETGRMNLSELCGQQPGTAVYACGPEELITAVEAHCRHWPAGSVHTERFRNRPADNAKAGAPRPFRVDLRKSGLSLTVKPGQSILHAVEEAGVSVLYACGEGTCGSCETRVLEGRPEHRDHVLDETDRARNDTMMICVSRASGDSLTLDL